MKTRKFLCLLLSAVMAFSLCSCNLKDVKKIARIADDIKDIAGGVKELIAGETQNKHRTELENVDVEIVSPGEQAYAFDVDGINLDDFSKDTAFVTVNGGVPFFTEEDFSSKAFIKLTSLDRYGRCGAAFACVSPETLPEEDRESIGMVKPSGWHTIRYDDIIEDKYLYNRCHLIAFCLSGLNADEENLITGTRFLNVTGMLPFETKTVRYVEKTGNHVLYRVTPIFEDKNLIATGVLMEAMSVEDKGEGLSFCVFCANVQPGIVIDYTTGDSYAAQ